jgi:Mrp family chromosome partitioning ATPase
MRRMKMDDDTGDFMSATGIGEMHELTKGEVEKYLVDEMSIGIADIISVPESPEDMERPMTHKVLFLDALVMGGTKHRMFFLPKEAQLMEQAVAEYKRMLMDEMMEHAPEPVRDLLENLNEVLRKLKEDDG